MSYKRDDSETSHQYKTANDIAKTISAAIDPTARVIFGAYHDRKMKLGQIKVTLIATGFNEIGMNKNFTSPSLFTSPTRASGSLKTFP